MLADQTAYEFSRGTLLRSTLIATASTGVQCYHPWMKVALSVFSI